MVWIINFIEMANPLHVYKTYKENIKKLYMKKGQYTLESWMIANGKSGDSFYSYKKDRRLTAIASHHDRKIITENLIIVSDYIKSPKADKITKVTLV